MSAAEFESLQDSLYLLSQPNFKEHFIESVREADVEFDDVFGEAQ